MQHLPFKQSRLRLGALVAGAFYLTSMAFAAGSLNEWISAGKPHLTLNPRYEYGKIDGSDASNAVTLKTLLGYTTDDWNGFSAKVEFTDTHALDDDQYNAAGLNGQPAKTVIADPETTELNQLFVKYGFESGSITAGRQRYILDNARFVGNVGWRQNEQTYDAVSTEFDPIEGLSLKAAYLDHINRIFADVRDWDSESFLLNSSYAITPAVSVAAYYYHLDFEGFQAPAKSHTLGGHIDGEIEASEELTFLYRAETALQEYDDVDVDTVYFHGTLGASFTALTAKVGYELLGSDDGKGQFLTPLATAHAWNGFADTYLDNGGAGGLQDLYVSISGKIGKLALTGVYHAFESDVGDTAGGTELDAVAVYPLTSTLKALAKIAFYDGEVRPDRERFIFQITATY